MFIKQIIIGLLTYSPIFKNYFWKSTGGSVSARYCYSVWMRHLVMAYNNKMFKTFPENVAELGPGDTLGIGITALLSGVKKYYAFDVVNYTTVDQNLKVLDELVQLFRNKTPIPDEIEFPKIKPFLDSYEFPSYIFSDDTLHANLSNERIELIKNSILDQKNGDFISFKVPWYDYELENESLVDMIYTQAVLEHVDNLDQTYDAMYKWLSHDGFISHQIDFKSHGLARHWDGHWKYSNLIWKIMRGRRLYFINRKPVSVHINLIKKYGFTVVCDQYVKMNSNLKKRFLPSNHLKLSEDDLETSGYFFQAKKNIKRY